MARNKVQAPKQIVLSEALARALDGRRVKAAVFTTFEFDPEFFELHVLSCLFPGAAWSHMPNVKRLQVGDALRKLEHVAVFFDHRGLRLGGGAARLDYDRIALARRRGVFHAKNVLILVENPADDDSASDSFLLITTSANLTRSGWHENAEVAHVLEIASGDVSAVRKDMLRKRGLLSVLEDAAPGVALQPAIYAIRQFLLNQTGNPAYLKHGGRLRPRLYVGRKPFSDFLCEAGRIRSGEYCLEIVSPFFENTADARTLKALVDAVSPRETRIYLPVDDEGKARCTKEYFDAVKAMPGVHWARLPEELTRWGRKGANVKHRNVHAKVYRLFKGGRTRERREIQVIGSVNLTGAAHAGSTDWNFETAVLVELPCDGEPEWWMRRLHSLPIEFQPRDAEDDAGKLACHEMALRFDWQEDVLHYFWKTERRPPQRACVEANGCRLFELEDLAFDRWCKLSDSAQRAMRRHLSSSSLVELVVEGESPQPLLVQEVNMARKPSLLDELSPAEILEYWSLLTPDQRNAFLERKLAELLDPVESTKKTTRPPETPESIFDRFAGIFHAFSCLEEHALEALKRGAEKEAHYRLLGTTYDSLPALVKQVTESAATDRVAAYVTLLCAGEVFRRLRRQLKRDGIDDSFLSRRKVRQLCDDYEREWHQSCEIIKSDISWRGRPDAKQFFLWYEKAFGSSVKPVHGTNRQEAALDSHRDFILRLSSFSLPLSRRDGGGKAWTAKADELRRSFPGLAEAALAVDGRARDAREQFKDAFACAVNDLLPHFDLIVLDEGHNMKHGFQKRWGAARNRLLAYVLGTKPGPNGRPLQRRVDRALILSATPVDSSFQDLWRQLDLLGMAEGFEALLDADAGELAIKQAAAQCLIRRLTHITIDGQPHTRNMYRREWRGGGVNTHDHPLETPDDLQRMIVALMQKKVADVLTEQGRKRHKRFNRSFQIGMLASFESFSRTAKVAGEDMNFDQSEQSENSLERQGIDTSTINDIAASYRETFQDSPPHPKMNAVADELWNAFLKGRKTLVFVRRIHSVPEMVEKLTKKYNDWLKGWICEELGELSLTERNRFDNAIRRYERQRAEFFSRGAVHSFIGTQTAMDSDDSTAPSARSRQDEPGGFESFFSWFFRGKGPSGILSGASFSMNRLEKPSARLSTLFEDNWLLWLLDYPVDPLQDMAQLTGTNRDQLAQQLRDRAAGIHPPGKAQKRSVFLAYQQAALEFLAQHSTDSTLGDKANTILDKLQRLEPRVRLTSQRRSFPSPDRFLAIRTFFTELAQRQDLCKTLWCCRSEGEFAQHFLEREQRRLLLSSTIRLGHPMVDIWLLYVKMTGSLALGRLDETDADATSVSTSVPLDARLAVEFLDLLDRQRAVADPRGGPTSFQELFRLATDFPLLMDVNFHEMRDRPVSEWRGYLADQLGQQQPIAGMYGGVARRTVSQFRMPGYPYVLVTTDVLQEGEDLHTYCDRIVHYGISWTPSAIEQRIGRVDRIGSLVQRRLDRRSKSKAGEDDYLQVYFPYLADTYEYVQVGIVFLTGKNRF